MTSSSRTNRSNVANRMIATVLCALISSALPLWSADNSKEAKEVRLIRQNSCAALQADFDSTAARLKGDARFQAYQQRLTRLEAIATQILKDMAIHRAAYARRNLATIGNSSEEAAGEPAGSQKLMQDNQAAFAIALPLLAREPDSKLAQKYYSSAEAAFIKTVRTLAQGWARGKEMTEIHRLALVLPLLQVTDEGWTDNDTAQHAGWIKQPEGMKALEAWALSNRRPRTAYSFSLALRPANNTAPAPLEFVDYLEKGADLMMRNKDYPGGIAYLTLASRTAKDANLTDRWVEVRFRLVEVLNDTGAMPKAMDELGELMRATPTGDAYGKAALLRLKYLYGSANGNKQILAEAPGYRKDPRCASYIPQILYIAWVANRQTDNKAESDALEKEFLEKFPEHHLGADIFFASALKALAGANYDEALRILQFIEYRYPTAKVMSKVKSLEQTLTKNREAQKAAPAAIAPSRAPETALKNTK